MPRAVPACILILALASGVAGQPVDAGLASDAARLDSYAATPDGRLIVAALMAERLNVHRNHLILLRRQTGRAYSALFVDQLSAAGKSAEEIRAALGELDDAVSRRLKSLQRSETAEGSPPTRAIGFLSTAVDRNAAATFYTAVPELGVETGRGSVVVGLPLYLNNLSSRTVSGLGDLYVQGQLAGRARGFDFAPTLAVAFPTGQSGRGLGAGKLTVDGSVAVERILARRLRPFLRAGVANYVFNNVAYQRPYISTGGAAHFSGGLTITLGGHVTLGAGGFSVEPFGDQNVTSREVMESGPPASPGGGQPPGYGMPPGMGHNSGHMPGGPSGTPQPGIPSFMQVSHATLPASDLRDRGANAWASVAITPVLSLQIAAARSVDFSLTTVHVGLGLNFGRLLFARGWR